MVQWTRAEPRGAMSHNPSPTTRRRDFVKRCAMGGCGLALATSAGYRLVSGDGPRAMSMGFTNDPPKSDWPFAREAEWYEEHLGAVGLMQWQKDGSPILSITVTGVKIG